VATNTKNTSNRLWGMYNEQNNAIIDESFENAKLVKKLPDEQNKIQKKHLALLDDVKIFMNETETWRSTLGGLSKIVRGLGGDGDKKNVAE
jgi:hypothetical protein